MMVGIFFRSILLFGLMASSTMATYGGDKEGYVLKGFRLTPMTRSEDVEIPSSFSFTLISKNKKLPALKLAYEDLAWGQTKSFPHEVTVRFRGDGPNKTIDLFYASKRYKHMNGIFSLNGSSEVHLLKSILVKAEAHNLKDKKGVIECSICPEGKTSFSVVPSAE